MKVTIGIWFDAPNAYAYAACLARRYTSPPWDTARASAAARLRCLLESECFSAFACKLCARKRKPAPVQLLGA